MTSTADGSPGPAADELLDALRRGDVVRRADVMQALRDPRENEPALVVDLAQEGVRRFPGNAGLRLRAGRAIALSGEHALALPHLRAALDLGLANEAPARSQLARALAATGAPLSEVDDAFAAAIRAGGDELVLVRAWKQVPRGADDVPLLDRLSAVQDESAQPLPGVLRALFAAGATSAHAARHADAVQAFLDGDQAAVCRRAWDAYTHLRPWDPADVEDVRRMPSEVLQLFFLATPMRVVPFERIEDAELGLDQDAVRWWREDFLTPDLPQPDDRVFQSDHHRHLARIDDPRLAHQTRAVRDRRLVLRDPVAGDACAPFDAVVNFGRAVYSFGRDELAWFVSAGAGFRATYLILPGRGLLLDLGSGLGPEYRSPERLANLCSNLLRRTARLQDLFVDAVATRPDPDARRSVVLQISVPENFAHHVWNLYPGLERIIDHGLAENVDEIRDAGTQFYGPLAELFPEFANARLIEEDRQGIRDPYPFSREHLLVVPGGYFIRRSLIRRIRDRMAQLPPTPGYPQPPVADHEGTPRPPVVWIGLRVRSRAWTDQETEVPRLIDALHERYPSALVVLDAYSYPVGKDLISAQWRPAIDELGSITRKIRAAVAHPELVVDLVGSTLREAVLWAGVTDVYVAPNGTSQHKVGWFGDAPGIVYAPRSLGQLRPESRPGAREAEGRPIPSTIFGEVVGAGERRWASDIRVHLENIRINGEELLTAVSDLLESSLSRHDRDAR